MGRTKWYLTEHSSETEVLSLSGAAQEGLLPPAGMARAPLSCGQLPQLFSPCSLYEPAILCSEHFHG